MAVSVRSGGSAYEKSAAAGSATALRGAVIGSFGQAFRPQVCGRPFPDLDRPSDRAGPIEVVTCDRPEELFEAIGLIRRDRCGRRPTIPKFEFVADAVLCERRSLDLGIGVRACSAQPADLPTRASLATVVAWVVRAGDLADRPGCAGPAEGMEALDQRRQPHFGIEGVGHRGLRPRIFRATSRAGSWTRCPLRDSAHRSSWRPHRCTPPRWSRTR